MINDYEPEERAGQENGLVFALVVIFIVLILLTICILGVKLLSQLVVHGQTPTQVVPVVVMPTDIPMAMPVNYFSNYSPIILSGSVPASVQIWIVTNIKNLGYELDGQRYDLATFKRIDSQDTTQAYCINRGWDIPAIGAEYWLNAEGIFIPLHEPNADPIQRFLKIK